MIDKIALDAAREIEKLPREWPEVRRLAAIQTIIAAALRRISNDLR